AATILYVFMTATLLMTTAGYSVLIAISVTFWLTIRRLKKYLTECAHNLENTYFVLDTIEDFGAILERCRGSFEHIFFQTGILLIPSYVFQIPNIFGVSYILKVEAGANAVLWIMTLLPPASCHSSVKAHTSC
ncbi:unnamed protein product, partial [Allacma fusca]